MKFKNKYNQSVNGRQAADMLYKKPTPPRYKLTDPLSGHTIVESDDPQDIIKHITNKRPQSVYDRKEGYFCTPDVAFKKRSKS